MTYIQISKHIDLGGALLNDIRRVLVHRVVRGAQIDKYRDFSNTPRDVIELSHEKWFT